MDLFNGDSSKAKILFKEFHKIENDSQCLEIDETRKLKDGMAIEIIKEICNISYYTDMQEFHIEERDKYLKIIKERGLSTRQIARLTGISRGIILKRKNQ